MGALGPSTTAEKLARDSTSVSAGDGDDDGSYSRFFRRNERRGRRGGFEGSDGGDAGQRRVLLNKHDVVSPIDRTRIEINLPRRPRPS